MNKAYNKITWQNKPSTATPLNQTNLNEMSNALDTIDDRVIALDSGKVGSVTITNTLQTGDTIATITVDGTATNIKSAQVEVDDTPSATSENPLQNKAIYEMLNNLLPEETVQGNPIAISDASGLNAKSCSVDLLPIQDLSHGEPSPTNICPISGRTQVSVTRTGKNLLPLSVSGIKSANTSGTWSGNTYTLYNVDFTILTDSDDNVIGINVNGTMSGGIEANFRIPIVAPVGDYYANGCADGGGSTVFDVFFYNATTNVRLKQWNGTSNSISLWDSSTSAQIKVENTTDNLQYRIRVKQNAQVSNKVFYPMIRLGTETDGTFEPYQGSNVTVQFGQTVYGGTLDVTNGKLTIDRGFITYDGTENWQLVSGTNRFYYTSLPSNIDKSSVISNSRVYRDSSSAIGGYFYFGGSSVLFNRTVADQTTDQFKSELVATPVQVCYPLATPTETTLTAEQISLLKGNNTLTTDGDNINLVYSADIGLYIAGQLQNS